MECGRRLTGPGVGARAGETRRIAPLALDPRSLTDEPFTTNVRWIVVARWIAAFAAGHFAVATLD